MFSIYCTHKKKDDPSDDVYYKVVFKTVEVEEGKTLYEAK